MLKEANVDFRKERAKRDFQFKEEKAAFERNLSHFAKQQELTNYLLFAIAMILLGLFIREVMGGLIG